MIQCSHVKEITLSTGLRWHYVEFKVPGGGQRGLVISRRHIVCRGFLSLRLIGSAPGQQFIEIFDRYERPQKFWIKKEQNDEKPKETQCTD